MHPNASIASYWSHILRITTMLNGALVFLIVEMLSLFKEIFTVRSSANVNIMIMIRRKMPIALDNKTLANIRRDVSIQDVPRRILFLASRVSSLKLRGLILWSKELMYILAALLVFNSAEKLSYSEINSLLNLSDEDIIRLLHSLASAKHKICPMWRDW